MNKARLLTAALLACSLAACSDDPKEDKKPTNNEGGTADGYAYVVASSSGQLGYLQQVDNITTGLLDATQNTNNRVTVEGSMDFIQVGDYLLNVNYAAHSSDGVSTLSYSYEIADGVLTRRQPMDLEGDIKSRGVYGGRYLIAGSSQDDADNDCYYERIKVVDVVNQEVINNNGRITIDKESNEYKAIGEYCQFSDIAQSGDYVLISYTTKQESPSEDAAKNLTRKPSTTTTLKAFNTYVGVYTFDPTDPDREYLKYRGMLVAEADGSRRYGQIRGNSASRTETGIEPLDDGSAVYYFCQGGSSNEGDAATLAPSVILRSSGGNLTDGGMPTAFDSDYYVNLLELTGNHYLWRVYYLGGTKFCLQLFSEPNVATGKGIVHGKFAIYDVRDGSYREVTGMPDASEIEDIALFVMIEKADNGGSATFAVKPNIEGSRAALYTIKADGTATRGLEINAEGIEGVARVTNWNYVQE